MQFFLDDQAHSRTDIMSTSGYEVIEHTYPYSADYQSLNEYDMMSDFHSDTLHDSSQPDMQNPAIDNGRFEAGSTGNHEQPSNTRSPSLNISMAGVNTQEFSSSNALSPEITKPVFRKTPLPSRRLIKNSKDSSFTLLPFYQRDKNLTVCNSLDRLEGGILSTNLITTDNERNNILTTEISNPCSGDDQHTDKGTAAISQSATSCHFLKGDPALLETGKVSSSPANACYDFEDAVSVYEVYTI